MKKLSSTLLIKVWFTLDIELWAQTQFLLADLTPLKLFLLFGVRICPK